MKSRWTAGNHFELLENGEAFYPRVFDAIAKAQNEVLIEAFIVFEDKVGLALKKALIGAAQRGVRTVLLVDGWGSGALSETYVADLGRAGVRLNVFDPQPWFFGWRPKILRRMHRKTAVIDGRLAFVGGINYSADHLADFGPLGKQDYSVAIEGPLVSTIRRFVDAHTPGHGRLRNWWRRRRDAKTARISNEETPSSPGNAQASFVVRDNGLHRHDIERHYRMAIRFARHRIIIANAYFFPGFRLLRDMRRAARRGVSVQLILQGQPDIPIVRTAARLLHGDLLKAGVRIHEYWERPLHGKVALVDDEWATVGSSNLDPLSLSLNLEANVMIRDSAFNQHLASRLQWLIDEKCMEVTLDETAAAPWWSKLRDLFVYHALRLYPQLTKLLPAHDARVETLTSAAGKTNPS